MIDGSFKSKVISLLSESLKYIYIFCISPIMCITELHVRTLQWIIIHFG